MDTLLNEYSGKVYDYGWVVDMREILNKLQTKKEIVYQRWRWFDDIKNREWKERVFEDGRK